MKRRGNTPGGGKRQGGGEQFEHASKNMSHIEKTCAASLQLSWLDTLMNEEPYEDSSFTGGLEQFEKLLKRYSVVGVESTLRPSM